MSNPLKTQFKPLMDRIDAMSLRERAMVFLVVMGVMVFAAMQFLFFPLRAEHDGIRKQLDAKNQQVETMNQQVQVLLGASGEDSPEKQVLASLEQQLKQLDDDLNKMTNGMVSPQQMAKLLEQVLARHQGIELVKIETLPKALAFGDTVAAGTDKPAGAVVYRHGVRLQVKGRYFDVVNYLKALEALPWKVYWGEVALESDKYPVSRVTLVIYTLSRNPGWIGA
jgi:MSHA biogenesis protein MshJ